MAEVCAFGPCGMAVDEIRAAGENEQRGKTRGNDVGFPDPEMLELELIEFARRRQAFQPNAQSELRCMNIGHVFALKRC
jgi:hypothetical protein